MAQLINGQFNANNVDPTQSLGNLPIGKHPVIIEKSEIKANSKNDGGYVEFSVKVIDGPSAGAVGAYRLNLYHSNQTTVDIAQRQLSALCHVTGVYIVENTEQLHNIPFVVEVGYQKGEDPASNPNAKGYTEVKRVFDMQGNEPGKQGQGGNANPAPQNNANNGGNGAGWNGGGQANNGAQPGQNGAGNGNGNAGNGQAWGNGSGNAGGGSQTANGGSQPAWGNGNAGNGRNNAGNGGNNGGGWQQNNGGNAGGGAPWGTK